MSKYWSKEAHSICSLLPHCIPGEGLKSCLWAPSWEVLYLSAMANLPVLFMGLSGYQVLPWYHKGTCLGHPLVSQNWEFLLGQMYLLIFRSVGLRNALQIGLPASMQKASQSKESCQVWTDQTGFGLQHGRKVLHLFKNASHFSDTTLQPRPKCMLCCMKWRSSAFLSSHILWLYLEVATAGVSDLLNEEC